MDIQTRKLSFIQEFLKLQNEEIISLFEQLLNREKTKIEDRALNPISIDEFNQRIDESLEDSKNDRVIKSSELKAEIEKWY